VQVTETVTDAGSAAYTMRELHYSAGWQVIQEGEYIEAELGGQVVYMSDEYNENVWSLAYVDAMVLQDRYDSVDPKPAPERTYAIQDASYTVTSLLQSVGGVWQVVQRHVLDPYGLGQYGSAGPSDGVYDASWNAVASGGEAVSDWRYLHHGGFKTTDGLYHFRHRSYDPYKGKWLQRDPAGYIDGLNLYEYVGSNPVNNVDPSGQLGILATIAIGMGIGALFGGGATICYTGTNGGQTDWSYSNVRWGEVGTNALIGAAAGGVAAAYAVAAVSATSALMLGSSPSPLLATGLSFSEGMLVAAAGGYAGASTYSIADDSMRTGKVDWAKAHSQGVDGAVYSMAAYGIAYGVNRLYSSWQNSRISRVTPRGEMSSRSAPRPGTGNVRLGQRLRDYKMWKTNANIQGKPTAAQFRRFMGAHRAGTKYGRFNLSGSNGSHLYPANTSRFKAWNRMAGRIDSHHGFPREFADDFSRIGLSNINDYVFRLPRQHHLGTVHSGFGGGEYNGWWESFFQGYYGGPTRANALKWLDIHLSNNFVVGN